MAALTLGGRGVAASFGAPWLLAILAACGSAEPHAGASTVSDEVGSALPVRCVEDFAPGRDYFAHKARLRHAQGFSIEYHGHYKVLRTHPPLGQGGGEDAVVLHLCGTPAPELEGDLLDAPTVEIPVRTAAANEDLSLTRMRVLGLADRVVGVGSGGIYDPELRARWENGEAVEIGASFHGPPRFEVLLEAVPGVTFLSTASLDAAAPLHRARALGLGAVPSVSWVEPTLLAQAEWLHQVATLFDAEEVANERLAAIEGRYEDLADRASRVDRRPLVLWLDPAGQGDRWTVPVANWKARAVTDAGGRTYFGDPDGDPTREVTSEEILTFADSIDFVLTESVALDVAGSAGVLEGIPAVRQGRIYSVHRRSRPEDDAYDWYETAVVEVDLVLEDLVALLHPGILPGHGFHHLRPARSSPVTSSR